MSWRRVTCGGPSLLWPMIGYSSRGWGLLLDNIIGLDVILANGSFAQTSATSYPDIFWVSIIDSKNIAPLIEGYKALRGAAERYPSSDRSSKFYVS